MRIETKHIFSACIAVLAANLLVLPPVLGRLLPAADPERYRLGEFALGVHCLSGALIATLLILRKGLCRELRAGPLVVASLLGLVAGELFLRAALFWPWLDLPLLRYAGLYADPYTQEDYWVLEWMERRRIGAHPARSVHPILGWIGTERGKSEASGARIGALPDIPDRPLLFFGDSFVSHLPELMDQALPGYSVLDFGVSGYGTDQTVLRLELEVSRFRTLRPVVLLGVLPEDMDRSLLRFRDGQKPCFTERGQVLYPRFATDDEFVAQHQFGVRSFLVSGAFGLARLATRSFDGDPVRRHAVNEQVFARASRLLRGLQLDAAFVVFCTLRELAELEQGELPARHAELRGLLAQWPELHRIETHEHLLAASRARRLPLSEFYLQDGHHSGLGNEVISQGLTRFVEQTFGGVSAPEAHR
jgi:hypothetical protein